MKCSTALHTRLLLYQMMVRSPAKHITFIAFTLKLLAPPKVHTTFQNWPKVQIGLGHPGTDYTSAHLQYLTNSCLSLLLGLLMYKLCSRWLKLEGPNNSIRKCGNFQDCQIEIGSLQASAASSLAAGISDQKLACSGGGGWVLAWLFHRSIFSFAMSCSKRYICGTLPKYHNILYHITKCVHHLMCWTSKWYHFTHW